MKRTYHYDEATKQMVEGPAPRGGDNSGDGYRFSDRLYSDNPFLGADGSVINSRRKHRDYMRRNNLTTADDFKKSWDDASHKRAEFYTKGADHGERREQIARAFGESNRRSADKT
jgi:hypothetical protein